MRKSRIKLSERDKRRLESIKDETSQSSKWAKKKSNVILLLSDGRNIRDVIKETNLSKRTIINYENGYLSKGFNYIHDRSKYKKSILNDVKVLDSNNNVEKLSYYFKKYPPKTYKKAQKDIEEKFNVIISESATRAYLNKNKIYTSESIAKQKSNRNWSIASFESNTILIILECVKKIV